jgi:hypothetical protein
MSSIQSAASRSQTQQNDSTGTSGMSRAQSSHILPQISSRSHHRDLRPLATNQVDTRQLRGRSPTSRSPESGASRTPDSATSLASPTLAAIRQYYHDTGLKTALQTVSSSRQPSLKPHQEFPRRHSILSPGGLATRVGKVTVSSPSGSGPSAECPSIAAEPQGRLLNGVNCGELAKIGSAVSKREPPWPNPLSHTAGKIPSEYTHGRLREWGHVYLGNIATADVFVKAVHLRKPDDTRLPLNSGKSPERLKNSTPSIDLSKDIVVRARVHPKAKERKPFLMQRRFNRQVMQASASWSNTKDSTNRDKREEGIAGADKASETDPQMTPSRSKSIPSSESSDTFTEQEPQTAVRVTKPPMTGPRYAERRTMPIR